jgi:hypothetical protein
MSKPNAPFTPYYQDELNKRRNAIIKKKYNIILRHLLGIGNIPTFEAEKVAHDAAVSSEARTLVVMHQYIDGEDTLTVKGPRAPRAFPSDIFKSLVTFEQLKALNDVGVKTLVHDLKMMTIGHTGYTFSRIADRDVPKLSPRVIHVKRNLESVHTKSIRFEWGFTKGYECIQKPNLHVFVCLDEKTHTACVKVDYQPPEGGVLVKEGVLIFNQESRVTTEALKHMWVKRNQTNETDDVHNYTSNPFTNDAETVALAAVFNGLNMKVNMLNRYFDLKHSATRFVTRDQSNRLRPDAYISHFRAQLRDIQKLHLTYAYLRGIAAVFFREIVETSSNASNETGTRPLPY